VGRKITYWVTTGLVAAFGFISAFTYLSNNLRHFKDSRTLDIHSNYESFLASPSS
jgi:hypothetical protein